MVKNSQAAAGIWGQNRNLSTGKAPGAPGPPSPHCPSSLRGLRKTGSSLGGHQATEATGDFTLWVTLDKPLAFSGPGFPHSTRWPQNPEPLPGENLRETSRPKVMVDLARNQLLLPDAQTCGHSPSPGCPPRPLCPEPRAHSLFLFLFESDSFLAFNFNPSEHDS